mmetsp:Transcript_38899/g.61497  ORF Transcript_38899/g.61497 Transcript_38899/m.61497 type:complete len:255 (-) Transcript_38899:103-867(-)
MSWTRWSQCLQSALIDCTSANENQVPLVNDDLGPKFHVTVDSFQLGHPVMFCLTVRRGDAVWRIRRRFRNVWVVHLQLLMGCGRSARKNGLPRPPPRTTPRSLLYGQSDIIFLERRGRRIESYLRELLAFIPCVEQCEPLYMFLCYVYLPRWDGDGIMVGGGAPPVDAKVVAKLPKAASIDEVSSRTAPEFSAMCVICQEDMDCRRKRDDIRVLPCGHQFHFDCISRWLKLRNTCCICNGPAVKTAPHFIVDQP